LRESEATEQPRRSRGAAGVLDAAEHDATIEPPSEHPTVRPPFHNGRQELLACFNRVIGTLVRVAA
jgi:hypothetical protein